MIKFSANITLYGKPNVGKSSLTNALGKKNLSAVTSKPQTTIKALKSVIYHDAHQLIFTDTPGIQKRRAPIGHRSANRIAQRGIYDSDINLMIIDASHWAAEDDRIIELAQENTINILVLNKCDLIDEKTQEALIEKATALPQFAHIIPTSVKKNINIKTLFQLLIALTPRQAWIEFNQVSEEEAQKKDIEDCLRAAMLQSLDREIPYLTEIKIRSIKLEKSTLHVHVDLVTDRESRKKMLIGKQGDMIKRIGKNARLALEARWENKVFLKTYVLVSGS